jgi:hypothetical protein
LALLRESDRAFLDLQRFENRAAHRIRKRAQRAIMFGVFGVFGPFGGCAKRIFAAHQG